MKVGESVRYGWEPYLKYGHKKVLAKDETLYSQGEKASGFYYLAEGKMNILLLSEEGKVRIIDYSLDGFLIGEQGILGQPYSTTAICDSTSCLFHFSIDAFRSICKSHPEAKRIFMNSLSSKIRLLAETVTMINEPYEKQMAHFLVQLHAKYNNFTVPITQISLAQYIGTSRITVYKIMQKWSEKKLISLGNQKIEILNLNGLKALL